jgi:hypothetical protein
MLAFISDKQAFDSEDELLSYYDAINDTSRSICAIVFEDLPPNGDPPDHLKYKIRISDRFYTADLFPAFSYLSLLSWNGKI